MNDSLRVREDLEKDLGFVRKELFSIIETSFLKTNILVQFLLVVCKFHPKGSSNSSCFHLLDDFSCFSARFNISGKPDEMQFQKGSTIKDTKIQEQTLKVS
jgi:hypothetical protein